MARLFALVYCIGGPAVAGSVVVAALVTGRDTLVPIVTAAVLGAAVAVPVCWMVARRLIGPAG